MNVKKLLRKTLACALCMTAAFSACAEPALAAGTAKTGDAVDTGVRVRDPFVLEYGGVYYMYGTGLQWDGYGCVYSEDLKTWSDPVRVYAPEGSCDGEGDWWAPECHYYKGGFYLFATYHSAATGKRGVGIFRAEDPLGPFEIVSDGHVTPKERDSIDGTLYVDEDGQPWMIYVGEWTSNEDGIGDMMAAKLSDDLTSFVSEPILLFRATDPGRGNRKVTDGPFLYKTENGRLTMIWSNMNDNGYCVNVAFSSNGRPDGKWRHRPTPLYEKTSGRADGGHGMLFTAPDGALTLSIHSPNESTETDPTTAVFLPVEDIGDTLVPASENSIFTRTLYRIYFGFIKIAELFDRPRAAGRRTGNC